MVRWASGVTKMRLRAVGGPWVAWGVSIGHPGGPDIVAEHAAELVVGHLADEGGPAAQGGDPGRRIGGRAAGGLDRRPHLAVQAARPVGVDQRHGAFDKLLILQELIVGLGDDIDDRIADRGDVEAAVGHKVPISLGVFGAVSAGQGRKARPEYSQDAFPDKSDAEGPTRQISGQRTRLEPGAGHRYIAANAIFGRPRP